MHGGHQVAQNSTIETLPPPSWNFSPWMNLRDSMDAAAPPCAGGERRAQILAMHSVGLSQQREAGRQADRHGVPRDEQHRGGDLCDHRGGCIEGEHLAHVVLERQETQAAASASAAAASRGCCGAAPGAVGGRGRAEAALPLGWKATHRADDDEEREE